MRQSRLQHVLELSKTSWSGKKYTSVLSRGWQISLENVTLVGLDLPMCFLGKPKPNCTICICAGVHEICNDLHCIDKSACLRCPIIHCKRMISLQTTSPFFCRFSLYSSFHFLSPSSKCDFFTETSNMTAHVVRPVDLSEDQVLSLCNLQRNTSNEETWKPSANEEVNPNEHMSILDSYYIRSFSDARVFRNHAFTLR